MLWLKEQKTNGSWHVEETKEFLLQGPPYKGAAWGTRELLDDVGTKWERNPAKKKDCDDKSIPRGWWCAPDEATMLKLLKLTHKGGRAWWCDGLTDTQLNQVEKWLVAFLGDDDDRGPTSLPRQSGRRSRRPRSSAPTTTRGRACPSGSSGRTSGTCPSGCPTPVQVCGEGVTDQFLDCQCQEARWQRCPTCMEKYAPTSPTRLRKWPTLTAGVPVSRAR